MGDMDLAKAVVKEFITEIPRQLASLKKSLDSGDALTVQRQAHTIKGASANMGGERMRDAAFQLEKAAQAGDWDAAGSLMTKLEMEFDRLKKAMKQEMERRQG